jgi:hypothetical protein
MMPRQRFAFQCAMYIALRSWWLSAFVAGAKYWEMNVRYLEKTGDNYTCRNRTNARTISVLTATARSECSNAPPE